MRGRAALRCAPKGGPPWALKRAQPSLAERYLPVNGLPSSQNGMWQEVMSAWEGGKG